MQFNFKTIKMKSTLYCKSSTVLLYFLIVLLVITISLLFSGVSLLDSIDRSGHKFVAYERVLLSYNFLFLTEIYNIRTNS